MKEIIIGKTYRHFKGKMYKVIDIVNDSESVDSKGKPKQIVIYQAIYGDHLKWARPYDMFAGKVDHKKYPDIKQEYRFEEVE